VNYSEEIIELLKQNKSVAEKSERIIDLLTAELEEQKEINKTMIKAFDSDSLIDFRKVAKTLNYKGYGGTKIMKLLRDKKILRDGISGEGKNEPYQQYVNQGLFKLIETEMADSYEKIRIFTKTVVTQKGLDYIRRILDADTTE
jgi:phage antirepressor YoqD-like protein